MKTANQSVITLLASLALLLLLGATSHAQYLYLSKADGTITAYSETTGAAVSGFSITGIGSGPYQMAIQGNNLYVAKDSIGVYNALTGAAINPTLVASAGFVGVAVNGTNLWAAQNGFALHEYDATTGATNTGFTGGSSASSLFVLDYGNNLLVSERGSNVVSEFNATTGALITANFITGLNAPVGLALSGNILYVANSNGNTIGTYNATTGAAINANFITGLSSPQGIDVFNNNLFVANTGNGTVGEYDATTGTAVNAAFISGLTGSLQDVKVNVVPEPGSAALAILGGASFLFRRRRNTIAV